MTPGALAIASTLLLLGALVAVLAVGWRRRRPDVWAVGALGLTLGAAVAIDAASTPKVEIATASYTLRWAAPAGMLVWLSLGWALLVLFRPRVRALSASTPGALAGIGVVAAVAVAVAATEDPVDQPYRQMRTLDHRVLAALPAGGTTRIDSADLYASPFQSGLVFWLRHEGRNVIAPEMLKPLGPNYARGRYDQVVRVQVQDAANPQRPPGRLIAQLPYHQPYTDSPSKVVTATILPAE